jgi:hypothetical protein
MTGTYRRGGRVRRDYFSRLRPLVPVARGGRRREIGLKWFVQALFRYGDNGEPFLGEVPIKTERSMDGLIGSSWNRTGSWDRPAGRSRNRLRDKPGDRSGGVLRDGKMSAVAQ